MLGTQLHAGGFIEKSLFRPVKNDFFIKPLGGLWTSSFCPQFGSDWVQWCIQEHFGAMGGEQECSLIFPGERARIFCVDSFQDLTGLLREYTQKGPMAEMASAFAYIDFEKAAEDFDAIHLTFDGQSATRYSRPGLYGWDCESTLWLNSAFSVKHAETMAFEETDRREMAERVLREAREKETKNGKQRNQSEN